MKKGKPGPADDEKNGGSLGEGVFATPHPPAKNQGSPTAHPASRCSIDPFAIACLRIQCASKYPLGVGGFAVLPVVLAFLGWWQMIFR